MTEYLTQKEAMAYVKIKSKCKFRQTAYYHCGFYSEGILLYDIRDLDAIIQNNKWQKFEHGLNSITTRFHGRKITRR